MTYNQTPNEKSKLANAHVNLNTKTRSTQNANKVSPTQIKYSKPTYTKSRNYMTILYTTNSRSQHIKACSKCVQQMHNLSPCPNHSLGITCKPITYCHSKHGTIKTQPTNFHPHKKTPQQAEGNYPHTKTQKQTEQPKLNSQHHNLQANHTRATYHSLQENPQATHPQQQQNIKAASPPTTPYNQFSLQANLAHANNLKE
eukprot:gene2623-1621_t